jgi:glycosyltransferase involved in cell wall biosynthesis
MGGISRYVLYLLPALAELNGAVSELRDDYLVFHSRKERRSFVPKAGERWRRKNLWTPCHHRIERWALSAELMPHGLDVFHSPDFIPPQWGARRRVITIHDLNFLYYPDLLTDESRRYYLDQIQWAAIEADAISADSESTRKDIINRLDIPPEKVKTIYLAANPMFQHRVSAEDVFATLQQFGLPRGYFLAVGTLEPRKNLPFLLRVYARLRAERGVHEPLVLVGKAGWKYQEIFTTIEELHLGGFVRHLDAVSDDELLHLYHAACAVVTPSFYEGFGLPALEAQHCGCPAVVSDRGSLPEIVGEEGIVLGLGDEQLWVDTLTTLKDDLEFRRNVIDHGRKQAGLFSWSSTARQTLSLYHGEPDPNEQPEGDET